MAKVPEYVHVVYQGGEETVRFFGIDFAKGATTFVTKAVADRLLDPEEHTGFALYEQAPPVEPAPAPAPPPPVAQANAEPVSQAAASEHVPPANKEPAQPQEA